MKKVRSLTVLVCLLAALFTGCGEKVKSSLAIYDNNGNEVVRLGMSRADVEAKLGTEGGTGDNVSYGGLSLIYRDDVVCCIRSSVAEYQTDKGVHVGLGTEEAMALFNEGEYQLQESSTVKDAWSALVYYDKDNNIIREKQPKKYNGLVSMTNVHYINNGFEADPNGIVMIALMDQIYWDEVTKNSNNAQ